MFYDNNIMEDGDVGGGGGGDVGGAATTNKKNASSRGATTATDNTIDNERLFVASILTQRIILKPSHLGPNIKDILTNAIKKDVEGKCIKEGYVLPESVEIQQYSCPKIDRGNFIYYLTYSANVCYPVEGMIIECKCDVKSRAGIHALYEYVTDTDVILTPIEIFIFRDHNIDDATFNRIKEKDKIKVCIIGTRIELGSSSVSVIGKLA
jgi:DNA-directed RNA polymerase subunit E'/Rpb7